MPAAEDLPPTAPAAHRSRMTAYSPAGMLMDPSTGTFWRTSRPDARIVTA